MAHVYVDSNAVGAGTGADWANAYVTLTAALTAKAAGDQFWVAQDHVEGGAASLTHTSPGTAAAPCTIRCVNKAGTVPPVSADLRTTAVIANTGATNINFAGYANCDGIAFQAGSGAVASSMTVVNAAGAWTFGANTTLELRGTTSGAMNFGATAGAISGFVELLGTTLKFGTVGQAARLQSARLLWRGGSVSAAGAIPTTLFVAASSLSGVAVLEGVDLSASGSGKTIIGAIAAPVDIHLKDCKLDAAVTLVATLVAPGGARVILSRTNATGINYGARQYVYAGSEIAGIDVVRTGGAAAAHKIATTANAKFIAPYQGLPLAKWNAVTGANVIVTVEGVANMAAIPKDDEVWFDVEYLGAATSPLGSVKSGTKADILATGTSLTASTEAWDSGATARANSTAYVVGDVIKVASNSGRVFFCTTAGTTAASEPAGFASAVDGGSVTDDTAVFRAGFRFKQAVTLSSPQPALAGLLYVYPKVGVLSATVYLDRAIGLS